MCSLAWWLAKREGLVPTVLTGMQWQFDDEGIMFTGGGRDGGKSVARNTVPCNRNRHGCMVVSGILAATTQPGVRWLCLVDLPR